MTYGIGARTHTRDDYINTTRRKRCIVKKHGCILTVEASVIVRITKKDEIIRNYSPEHNSFLIAFCTFERVMADEISEAFFTLKETFTLSWIKRQQ